MQARDVALRTRAWLDLAVPIEVDELLHEVGARHMERELEPDVWGLSFETERYRWVVTARGLSPAERRLTVLHEVGHQLMHPGNCLFLRQHDPRWADKVERAADEFAVFYGIPDGLVGRGLEAHELAIECGLPVEFAQLRLELEFGT